MKDINNKKYIILWIAYFFKNIGYRTFLVLIKIKEITNIYIFIENKRQENLFLKATILKNNLWFNYIEE
jgi:hypothetical protein